MSLHFLYNTLNLKKDAVISKIPKQFILQNIPPQSVFVAVCLSEIASPAGHTQSLMECKNMKFGTAPVSTDFIITLQF